MTNERKSDEYVEVFVPMDKNEVLKRGLKHAYRRIGIQNFDGYLVMYPKKYAAAFEHMIEAEIRAEKGQSAALSLMEKVDLYAVQKGTDVMNASSKIGLISLQTQHYHWTSLEVRKQKKEGNLILLRRIAISLLMLKL
jgi:hypothetical protein